MPDSESSSSSSGSPCEGSNECYFQFNSSTQDWDLTCYGGVGTVLCEPPARLVFSQNARFLDEIVPCIPFQLPSTSSSSALPVAAAQSTTRTLNAATAQVAYVRVPEVNNPSVLVGYLPVNLNNVFPRAPLGDRYGWQIYFISETNDVDRGVVAPPTSPTDDVDIDDRVLVAEVIVPESGQWRQYMVPVTERFHFLGYRLARLRTPEWTILCLRRPVT